MDPGFSRYEWRTAVGGRDRFRCGVNERGIERTGLRQMIEGLVFVEAGHFNGEFDRRTCPSISSDPSPFCVIGTTRR